MKTILLALIFVGSSTVAFAKADPNCTGQSRVDRNARDAKRTVSMALNNKEQQQRIQKPSNTRNVESRGG